MIDVTQVAFTFYPVTDLLCSRKFYEGTLGLKTARIVETDAGTLVEYVVGSSKLAIAQMDLFPPSDDGAAIALEVRDFDQAISALEEAKVEFYIDPTDTPLGRVAVILDPDGSKICICESNPEGVA